MKEAIIKSDNSVDIVDSPIPTAGPGQIVIKVEVSGSNPKDWKYPEWQPDSGQINQGDDIAGTIHEVGKGVSAFKVGDRVGAFHEMLAPHGSYAEYAVAEAYTTFHLPASVTFEEAAAIPLAAMTACMGLFHYNNLALPAPWESQKTSKEKVALAVWGGATAVGSYAIQLAKKAGIHPIIAVAGNGQDHVLKLLDKSKGDAVVDYRSGDDATIAGVKEAAKKAGVDKILFGFDTISSAQTTKCMHQILHNGGRLTTVLADGPARCPDGIYSHLTYVGGVHTQGGHTEEDRDFGAVYFHYLARGLELGWFKAHNPELVPGGLAGVEGALKKLKAGKSSAVKFVFRIADTPGVGK